MMGRISRGGGTDPDPSWLFHPHPSFILSLLWTGSNEEASLSRWAGEPAAAGKKQFQARGNWQVQGLQTTA